MPTETIKRVTTAFGGVLIFMGLVLTPSVKSIMEQHSIITMILGLLIIIYGADLIERFKR